MQTDDEELDDEELDDEELDDEEASAKTKAPAARRRAPSEADKRTTFQAGKAAFAAGQPETGHPANLHPGLVRDWGNGWRSAATEAVNYSRQVDTFLVSKPTSVLVRNGAAHRVVHLRGGTTRRANRRRWRPSVPASPWRNRPGSVCVASPPRADTRSNSCRPVGALLSARSYTPRYTRSVGHRWDTRTGSSWGPLTTRTRPDCPSESLAHRRWVRGASGHTPVV